MNQDQLTQLATSKIILPVDVSTLSEVELLIAQTEGLVGVYKFGLQTLFRIGLEPLLKKVRALTQAEIFLDAKLKDIPNTVAEAAAAFAAYDVDYITTYSDAGVESVRAIVNQAGAKTKILCVTVLTSIPEREAEHIYARPLDQAIPLLADMALNAGAHGLVCSPRDLAYLQDSRFNPLLKVTPGIRPTWAAANDQARIMTPQDAIIAGSTHLVIGRPITQPPAAVGSPTKAAQLINDEIAAGLQFLQNKRPDEI